MSFPFEFNTSIWLGKKDYTTLDINGQPSQALYPIKCRLERGKGERVDAFGQKTIDSSKFFTSNVYENSEKMSEGDYVYFSESDFPDTNKAYRISAVDNYPDEVSGLIIYEVTVMAKRLS